MIPSTLLQVSYMIQLIIASLLYMLPIKKRSHFVIRFLVASGILLCFAYYFGLLVSIPDTLWLRIMYWPLFAMLCIPLVMLCCQTRSVEAVYCVICANATQHAANELYLALQISIQTVFHYISPMVNVAIALFVYVAVYGAFYAMFVPQLAEYHHYRVSSSDIFPMLCILLFVWLLGVVSHNEYSLQGLVYHVSDALACFYIMWTQRNNHVKAAIQRERDGIAYTLLQQQKQYELTQETVDIINQKCHDLKHQIHALQQMQDSPERDKYFEQAEQAIMIYDTHIQTGNKALDTVLMEKSLYCQRHHIQLTCMPCSDPLEFMNISDIYALFGNALDNAIEATKAVTDPQKRVITVRFVEQGSILLIQVRNYYQHTIRFAAGLPITTHRDKHRHGFGIKSMKHTVEQYGGTLQIHAHNQVFTLQLVLSRS